MAFTVCFLGRRSIWGICAFRLANLHVYEFHNVCTMVLSFGDMFKCACAGSKLVRHRYQPALVLFHFTSSNLFAVPADLCNPNFAPGFFMF
jgi:hypothetical protein